MRTESKAPGRDPSQQAYERNHWVAEGRCNHRPIPEKESAHKGASRRVDVRREASPLGVIDPYGVLRDACFAVGAAIGRPQNNPPNMEHAEANS